MSETMDVKKTAVWVLGVPVVYLLYVAATGWLGLAYVDLGVADPYHTPIYLLSLAATGGLLGLAWREKLYLSTVVGVDLLLISPCVFGAYTTLMDAGYGLLVFALVFLALVGETAFRHRHRLPRLLRTDHWQAITAYALLYLGPVLWLQGFSRSTEWMQRAVQDPIAFLLFLALCLGTTAVGGTAAWLWIERGLRTPAAAAAAWLAWGYVLLLQQGPTYLGYFSGLRWVGLAPYPDTLLQWPIALILVFALAATEKTAQIAIASGELPP